MYLVCLFYVALFLSEINYLLVTTVKPVYNTTWGQSFCSRYRQVVDIKKVCV